MKAPVILALSLTFGLAYGQAAQMHYDRSCTSPYNQEVEVKPKLFVTYHCGKYSLPNSHATSAWLHAKHSSLPALVSKQSLVFMTYRKADDNEWDPFGESNSTLEQLEKCKGDLAACKKKEIGRIITIGNRRFKHKCNMLMAKSAADIYRTIQPGLTYQECALLCALDQKYQISRSGSTATVDTGGVRIPDAAALPTGTAVPMATVAQQAGLAARAGPATLKVAIAVPTVDTATPDITAGGGSEPGRTTAATTYATSTYTSWTTYTYYSYYYWTISWSYWYYYYTYNYHDFTTSLSTLTSSWSTEYTTISVYASASDAASSSLARMSSTLSLPTPTAATTALASMGTPMNTATATASGFQSRANGIRSPVLWGRLPNWSGVWCVGIVVVTFGAMVAL
ncbi:hypothetical protein CNMCM5623_003144 [Aspergillus felis]|uniref:Uncharacterized protein n=1 Tax=Aspergillus felis TaxID=1287682 RepID=A0A8H6PHY0_9EURO|nr:hypothetical protein CNMCM5623_003144 [Aspergillus felis]